MSYYETLGVERTATHDEIKIAYRRLAMKWHPDRNIGGDHRTAEAKFKSIQAAYETLSDPSKRASYDASMNDPYSSGSGFDGGFNARYWSWEESFRQARKPKPPPPKDGLDFEADISLSIEQACAGGAFSATVQFPAACPDCNGSGIGEPDCCSLCDGYGYRYGVNGEYTCRRCHGSGVDDTPKCAGCKGKAEVLAKRKVKLKVGGGLADGDRIRVRGGGEKGEHGGRDGNAYFTVRIKPHSRYRREGLDLHVGATVDFVTAILGGAIEVETPWGKRKLPIPPMTRANKMLRIDGAGLHSNSGAAQGSLYVTPVIDLLPGMEDYPLSAESELTLLVMRRMAENEPRKA